MVFDGVVVMIGVRLGVVICFEEVNSEVIIFYCLCYKLVFVSIDIISDIIYIKNIEFWLR